MTLTELSKMTFDCTSNGWVNCTKYSSWRELRDEYISKQLCKDTDKCICELLFPDGLWYCRLSRVGKYYDLYVPDTRVQEIQMISDVWNLDPSGSLCTFMMRFHNDEGGMYTDEEE